MARKQTAEEPGRGFTFLPSLLTTGNLMCGFVALLSAARGEPQTAAFFVLLGNVFDILDGQVARRIGIATAFGIEYDSLADVLTFGVAPAFLWATAPLAPWGRWAWAVGFLFVVGAALRLARFNVGAAADEQPSPFFHGLPTPGAAGVLATLALAWPEPPAGLAVQVIWLALPAVLGVLMVSTLPYPQVKRLPAGSAAAWAIIGIAGVLALVAAVPRVVLPVLFVGYALSGPVLGVWRWRQGVG